MAKLELNSEQRDQYDRLLMAVTAAEKYVATLKRLASERQERTPVQTQELNEVLEQIDAGLTETQALTRGNGSDVGAFSDRSQAVINVARVGELNASLQALMRRRIKLQVELVSDQWLDDEHPAKLAAAEERLAEARAALSDFIEKCPKAGS